MKEKDKPKEQLIDQLVESRQRIAELEAQETECKQAQEELQMTEQNFRNSLESSPLGVRIVSVQGELLYANQAILDIYGYSSFEELKATQGLLVHYERSVCISSR